MKTNRQKLNIEFDESFYESRVLEIVGDDILTTHQMQMIKGYYKLAYTQGETSGIKIARERFDNAFKTPKP